MALDTLTETRAHVTQREIVYTICPVLVASNVAIELGFVAEELAKVGAHATYLRSLKEPGIWRAHYNHDHPALIRDGGNSPAIQAHAEVRRTVLLGLTQAQPGGKIVVRADSGIYRVGDLKGRRVGLYRSTNAGKIDHRRATSHRGLLVTLALHGLKPEEVEWVDVTDADAHAEAASDTPAGIWAQRGTSVEDLLPGVHTHEAAALLAGKIDALYDYSVGLPALLERTGLFKVIEDLDRYPDWTLRIANAPRTLAVSRDFALENRDVVVAWLRAALRAGQWINRNPDAAAPIFLRSTIYRDAGEIARALRGYDLVHSLSSQLRAGLAIEKRFLLDHGYLGTDFEIDDWADPSFLEEAQAGLSG